MNERSTTLYDLLPSLTFPRLLSHLPSPFPNRLSSPLPCMITLVRWVQVNCFIGPRHGVRLVNTTLAVFGLLLLAWVVPLIAKAGAAIIDRRKKRKRYEQSELTKFVDEWVSLR